MGRAWEHLKASQQVTQRGRGSAAFSKHHSTSTSKEDYSSIEKQAQ